MKVKIKGIKILEKCNWAHSDFGLFANFLQGLLEDGFLVVEGEIIREKEKKKEKK